jgi:3-methyladenine DNA glycosylase AlkC
MAEPFKNLLNAEGVQALGQHLRRQWPRFDVRTFEAAALTDLQALEMKARAMQIASALEATLPARFDSAAELIEAVLAPPVAVAGVGGHTSTAAGVAGWMLWPVGEFVARRGGAAPERALACLHALTQRFTAEWALRPFLLQHRELTLTTLWRWAHDKNEHVRRAASEGSRPRLPWGVQLPFLIADPAPTQPILRALIDDSSDYVRRSVANHLNDISRDHPAVLEAWLQEHLPGASTERQALLRHASRSLIKAGHAGVLAHWGVGSAFVGQARLTLSARQVTVGGSLILTVDLRSESSQAQTLLADYAVHHVKANGSTSPKVFKGWRLELQAGQSRRVHKQHSLRLVTTRTYHPGRHRVELLINGKVAAEAAFTLRMQQA